MKVILRKTLLISLALLSSYSIAAIHIDINAFFADQKMDSPTARFLDQCLEKVLAHLGCPDIDHLESPFNLNDTQMQALVRATHEVMKTEDMISKQGRLSLVRGENKAFHINQKCFDVLMARDNFDFVSTRFNTDFSQAAIENGKLERNQHLNTGSNFDLFAGYSLFSYAWGDASPIGFYLQGMCYTEQPSNINPEYLFNLFDRNDIYKQYAQQINDLDQKYQKICPLQQLLVLSLSPDAVEKTVYPSNPGGSRRSYPAGIESTAQLLTALRKNPQSVPEFNETLFCHITTPDYGLHPDRVGKDIKVYTITGADPDEMEAYLKKEKALFDEIKQEIKKKNAHA